MTTATSTRIAVTGATGRMGQELLSVAADREGIEVAVAASRTPDAGPIEGHALEDAGDLPALYADRAVDVLIDFTAPEASVESVAAAADLDVASVVGTTGFSAEHLAAIDRASDRAPVLRAANFARGVQALAALVEDAAAALPGYDLEIIETHHDGKRDAPSGTAAMLADQLEAGRQHPLSEDTVGDYDRIYGREGESPRHDAEIGIHSVRAGDVAGEHEVLLAGDGERLSLEHRAGDRSMFAAGALDAAEWLDGRDAGRYAFRDVLDI